MKKLVSIALIGMSLSVLINCSPKTAKKTASSETRTEKKATDVAVDQKVNTEISTIEQAQGSDPVPPPPPPTTGRGPTTLADLPPDQQLVMFQGLAPQRVDMGHKLYTQHCGKCHKLNEPGSRSGESWVQVMTKMGPKAKLPTDQYMMVAAYLVQNAKK